MNHRTMQFLRYSMQLTSATLLLISSAQAQELRGTWLSRNELASRAQIARCMDSLANHNFNVVYVNAWSRGYPLFPSETFFKQTGMRIDPNYGGRDVLAEAIAEAHRRGIEVEAWFEYGFVGGWTGYYPGTSGKGKIFDSHPDWVAKRVDGSEIDGSDFYWMVHTRPDVQQFLLDLAEEVAMNYDIDGIELDRIRYAGLVYGYDSYTDSVYRVQHGGAPPPTNTFDPGWMRWRADILNAFMRKAYDTIKAVNPNVRVTNAPGFYSSSSYQSYNDNLQDWWQWVETGSVDHVQVQMYVSSNSTLTAYLDYLLAHVPKKEKMYPALATRPNATPTPSSELSSMVNTVRSRGLKGTAWWYYGDLGAYWDFFTELYATNAGVPGRPAGWRTQGLIVNETDSAAELTGTWQLYNQNGYQGKSLFADSIGLKRIDYYFDVPATGWYEVYAYIIPSSIRSARAPYDLFDSAGTRRFYIDQSNIQLNGWVKIGDAYCTKGYRKVVGISNEGIGYQKFVGADATMILLNRKLSPSVVLMEVPPGNFIHPQPGDFWLGQNYPNPFNSMTAISYQLSAVSFVTLKVYDVLGREVITLVNEKKEAGSYTAEWNAEGFPSGMYLYRLHARSGFGSFVETKRMCLVK